MKYLLDEETNKIYGFHLFEKWWYSLFLWFAWFLPHKCYEIENNIKYNREEDEKAKRDYNYGAMIGSLASIFLFRTIQINITFPKWLWIISFIIIYLSLVLMAVVILAITNNRKIILRKEESFSIKFLLSKVSPFTKIISNFLWMIVPLFLLGYIISLQTEDGQILIVILGLILICAIFSTALLSETKFISSNGKVYLIGNLTYILKSKK